MAERPRNPDAEAPDTQSGTTKEQDFGRTDRYANKDDQEAFNVRTTGDGTVTTTPSDEELGGPKKKPGNAR